MILYYLSFPDPKTGQMTRVINGGGFRNEREILLLLADRQANGEAFKDECVKSESCTIPDDTYASHKYCF